MGLDRGRVFIVGLVADVERGLMGAGCAAIRSVGRLATGGTAVGTCRDGDSAGSGTVGAAGTIGADWPAEASLVSALLVVRGTGGDEAVVG